MVEKFDREKFGKFTPFEHLAKMVWRIARSTKKLGIVSIKLDGFSLATHWRFAKFANPPSTKCSCYTVCTIQFNCRYQLSELQYWFVMMLESVNWYQLHHSKGKHIPNNRNSLQVFQFCDFECISHKSIFQYLKTRFCKCYTIQY